MRDTAPIHLSPKQRHDLSQVIQTYRATHRLDLRTDQGRTRAAWQVYFVLLAMEVTTTAGKPDQPHFNVREQRRIALDTVRAALGRWPTREDTLQAMRVHSDIDASLCETVAADVESLR